MNKLTIVITAGVLLAAAAALYVLKLRNEAPALPPPPVTTVTEVPVPATPAVKYPVEPLQTESAEKSALPPLSDSDAQVRTALLEWLGKDSVAKFLQLDNFVRHVVATADNLGRSHAAPRLWPVSPMPGRFTVQQAGDGTEATAGNAERYAAFLAFVEAIDTKRALALYVRWYPWFQQAYEELGYPGRYFNDRLIEVIDLMIATPIPSAPIQLRLTEVKGPIASTHPWLRYEFADPALEALPAGQKIMLRVGPANQRRLKAKLSEVRTLLTEAAPRN
ncbi:MAG TPA: DUF3014 domain-containing protein [Burkholderiaceae bacterium]|nr:DUF3014 domain-containing protein [Burkholderiaceae bacterium]